MREIFLISAEQSVDDLTANKAAVFRDRDNPHDERTLNAAELAYICEQIKKVSGFVGEEAGDKLGFAFYDPSLSGEDRRFYITPREVMRGKDHAVDKTAQNIRTSVCDGMVTILEP